MDNRPNPSRRQFSVLIVALLVIAVGAPIIETLLGETGALLTESAVAVSLIAALLTVGANPQLFRVALVLIAINVVATALWLFTDSVIAGRTANAAGFAFLCTLALSAMRTILEPGPVTLDKMIGALCIYLLIGIAWAELYQLIYSFNSHSFSGFGDQAGHLLSWRMNYFSFVTLTTLGYGDILPATALAQSITVIETLVGQLYLAVLVAALVSSYLAENRKQSNETD